MTYEDIRKSLEILGLKGDISFKHIKKRFRELSKKYHPDLCQEDAHVCAEKMQQIKEAYSILEEYCTNFKFHFTREEFYDQYPEELVREHFYGSGPWGRKD